MAVQTVNLLRLLTNYPKSDAVLMGEARDSLRSGSARYPRLLLGVRPAPLHQTQERLLQAKGRRAGTWRWPERSPRGPVPSPYHRVGWGRAGRRSELLGDAQAT